MSNAGNTIIDRRHFMGGLITGAGALGLGATSVVAGTAPSPTEIESMLGMLAARPHKQVFDAPRANDSMPVIWSWVMLFTNNQLGIPDKDVGAFVVFRHEAIPLAMNDAMWRKYKFGEMFNITDKTTDKPSVRNVVVNTKPEDLPMPEMALDKVQQRGVLFGVCNLAITVFSQKVAEKTGQKADDVKEEWQQNVLPGIVLLPSGVWGVNRAQEAGLTYCFAG